MSIRLPDILSAGKEHILNALLPYLNLGFVPVPTSSRDFLCAIDALRISYNGARITLAELCGSEPPAAMPKAYFENMFRGQRYDEGVRDHMAIQIAMGALKEGPQVDGEVARLLSRDWLDVDQIMILLDLVNADLGTHFQLGVIAQGFRTEQSHIINGEQQSAYKITPHSIYLPGELQQSYRSDPVVWIWNNNAALASADADSKSSHWEGLDSYTSLETKPKELYNAIERVLKWNLWKYTSRDFKRGVFVLSEDIVPLSGIKNMLIATAMSFLRDVDPPAGVEIPHGMRYMSHSNDKAGLVSEKSITQVRNGYDCKLVHARLKRHLRGISTYKDAEPTSNGVLIEAINAGIKAAHATDVTEKDQKDPSSSEKKAPSKEQKLVPPRTSSAKNTEKPTEPEAKPATETKEELYFNPGELIPMQFYRCVELTSKNGVLANPPDHSQKFINKYIFHNGDFVVEIATHRNPNIICVMNMKGKHGYIHARCLQRIERCWNLPLMLPYAQLPYPLDDIDTKEDLEKLVKLWGIKRVDYNFPLAIKDLLIQFQERDTTYLPLFRVLRSEAARTYNQFTDPYKATPLPHYNLFLGGEIVLGCRAPLINGLMSVTDFEGYRTFMDPKYLEAIRMPYKTRFSISGLETLVGGRLGMDGARAGSLEEPLWVGPGHPNAKPVREGLNTNGKRGAEENEDESSSEEEGLLDRIKSGIKKVKTGTLKSIIGRKVIKKTKR